MNTTIRVFKDADGTEYPLGQRLLNPLSNKPSLEEKALSIEAILDETYNQAIGNAIEVIVTKKNRYPERTHVLFDDLIEKLQSLKK